MEDSQLERLAEDTSAGGVHRGAGTSFDISADLAEFGRTPIAVVSAGVKSILDAGLTLEYLETLGVPVIGSRCDDFPGYLTTSSGRPNPARVDDLDVLVDTIRHHWQLAASTSVLVTHPIADGHSIDREEMEQQIDRAMAAVADAGVTGPDVTPFMLRELSRSTANATSAANREVLLSVTELGGHLASAMAAEQWAEAV